MWGRTPQGAADRWRRAARPGSLLPARDGPRSAVDPAGPEAARPADLIRDVTIGGTVIRAITTGAAVHAARVRPGAHPESTGHVLILMGGVSLPAVVPAGPPAHGLVPTGDPRPPPGKAGPSGAPRVHVSGERR